MLAQVVKTRWMQAVEEEADRAERLWTRDHVRGIVCPEPGEAAVQFVEVGTDLDEESGTVTLYLSFHHDRFRDSDFTHTIAVELHRQEAECLGRALVAQFPTSTLGIGGQVLRIPG